SGGGNCGSLGPSMYSGDGTTPNDPIPDNSSNVLDISVYVAPDSSESDMTESENPK
ncbi:hypothetical protein Tco_0384332, partial [Tanacetum coccineum]